jgi:hypothetical protein
MINNPKNKIQTKNCMKVEARSPSKEPVAALKALL